MPQGRGSWPVSGIGVFRRKQTYTSILNLWLFSGESLLPGCGHVHASWGALTSTPASSRLLLIEADEAVATALSRALGRHGWTVLSAPTAKAGLHLQAAWAPHVVLLASDLPDMAVGTLVTRLAEQGGCGILVLSGHGEEDFRRTALERGAHDVLGKPMRAGDVAARIRAVQCRLGQPVPAQAR